MKKILLILLLIPSLSFGQTLKEKVKKTFKFSTFYAAVNGGSSLSDVNTFSVNTGQLVSGVQNLNLELIVILIVFFSLFFNNSFVIYLTFMFYIQEINS